MTRLQKLGTLFVREGNLEAVLGEVVEAAIGIARADFGSIQVLDEGGSTLHLAAQRGFPNSWVDYWNTATAGSGTCGTALARLVRVIVQDVERSPIFVGTQALQVQRRAGVRAVQSTPLVSRSGRLVGMLSTHWKRPHQPEERVLRLLDLLAQQAAEILERQEAEQALRRSETRLSQAIRVAGLGTFEHDHLSDVIQYSALMRELMGFAADEELTLPAIQQRVPVEDRDAFAAAIRKAHDPAGDGLFEVEYRVVDAARRVRWMSARSQTFFEGHGSARHPVRTIGAALDITGRKAIQAELEKLVAERTAKLQELVGELEHFSYSITHDMRAPLRGMIGYGELVRSLCADGGQEEVNEFIRRIITAAERMDRLITDALNYSRSVRQELPLKEVDTGALLRGMLDTYPEWRPAKAHIRVEGKLPVVLGNEAALTQCFSNLLGNAVKFVVPGEVPQIRIWAEEHEGRARIFVEDKGIGIPQEFLPRVFDMFSRGTSRYEGTGIGLALVRKVVQRIGGRVGVESELGKGSRFWLELRLPSDGRGTPPRR